MIICIMLWHPIIVIKIVIIYVALWYILLKLINHTFMEEINITNSQVGVKGADIGEEGIQLIN